MFSGFDPASDFDHRLSLFNAVCLFLTPTIDTDYESWIYPNKVHIHFFAHVSCLHATHVTAWMVAHNIELLLPISKSVLLF